MFLAAALAALAALAANACGDPAYVELIVADERLPFLKSGVDYNALGVEARATSCANTQVKYPAQELPATLTVLPGDCFKKDLSLQAFALFGDKRIAQSTWLAVNFPASGPLVATATLASLPGPQVRFRTGFEPGEPLGGTEDQLFVVKQRDIDNLVARVDPTIAVEGARSIVLSGVATSTRSHVLVRAAAADLLVMPGDRLIYAQRIDPGSAPATMGIDLVLDSGKSALELGLVDQDGSPIHPASDRGRVRSVWQRYIVDLTPAAGTRLVGILLGFDARQGGGPGNFTVHLDDLWIETAGL